MSSHSRRVLTPLKPLANHWPVRGRRGQPTLSLDDPARLLFALAASFSFWPTDSIVVGLIEQAVLHGVMRLDRTDASPAALQHLLAPALRAECQTLVLLGGFGERALVDPVLREAELVIPPERFVDRMGTDGTRVWVGDGPEARLPRGFGRMGDGTVLTPDGVLASRDAVVARVKGPDIDQQAELLPLVLAADKAATALGRDAAPSRVRDLVARGLRGGTLGAGELVELSVLIVDMGCRDAAWVCIDDENAERSLELWLEVRRHAIDLVAPETLCMAATAAWVSRQWVVMGECLQQAAELDPEHSLTSLLTSLWQRGASPSVWCQMLPQLRS